MGLVNSPFGMLILLLKLAVCTIFNYWEDHYRDLFAKTLGYGEKDGLMSDPFGDLRLIRISITHHHGIAKSDVRRMKNFKYFTEGKAIAITEEILDDIVNTLLSELEKIGNDITEQLNK